MDYQEAIDFFEKELKCNTTIPLTPMLDGKKTIYAQYLETAISAMQELKMYKDGKLCLIPEDVYGKQCEELDAYKQLGLKPVQIIQMDKLYREKCEELARLKEVYGYTE